MKRFLLFSLGILFISCGQETKYLYHQNIPEAEFDRRIYPLSTMEAQKNIDILFIIDNSGSMGTIQRNVVKNARLFMEQFLKNRFVNWKIGLISTDDRDIPYLGFNTSFDASLINSSDPTSFDRVVNTFQTAVGRLGTGGSGSEYVFYNIKRAIDSYNSFLRPNSHLVVVMISDEPEQSLKFGPNYNAMPFFNIMSQFISRNKILRFYGALSFSDLQDCKNPGRYAGSPFETIINLSKGFNISACTPNFGQDLARLGQDIVSLIGHYSLLLKQRPVAKTIKVYYKNKLLPAGPKEQGGMWFYEENTNTINFYSLSFVEDPSQDVFKIDFEIDDGENRDDIKYVLENL